MTPVINNNPTIINNISDMFRIVFKRIGTGLSISKTHEL